MSKILELRGRVRENPWGSRTLLSELFGFENPTGGPQAEYWMGVHPGGPAEVRIGDAWLPLSEWIAEAPESRLGTANFEQFGAELPFLFKILAADEPLSLQAHPNAEQARAGFELENERGVEIDDPVRNFRDPFAKPELLCALTPFDAMLGFRDLAEMHELVSQLDIPELNARLEHLHAGTTEGLRTFFASLFDEAPESRARLALDVVRRCAALPAHPARHWVIELAKRYPEDICVLAPMLLNVIRLDPGQAVFLPPGELHCYLDGCGVEIMSSSDNVLRCGLTRSHADVPALLEVLTFSHADAEILEPTQRRSNEWTYATPAREFELSRIDLRGRYESAAMNCLQVLLMSEGSGRITAADGSDSLELERGSAVVVAADAGAYEVNGTGRFFRATAPEV